MRHNKRQKRKKLKKKGKLRAKHLKEVKITSPGIRNLSVVNTLKALMEEVDSMPGQMGNINKQMGILRKS